MPAWAVALAIGGGVVVGFVFLRGGSSAAADVGDAEQQAAAGGTAARSGAAGAPIPWDQLLSGLGITSPDYVAPTYSDQSGATIEQQQDSAPALAPLPPGTYLDMTVNKSGVTELPTWSSGPGSIGGAAGAGAGGTGGFKISGGIGAGLGSGPLPPTVPTPTGHGSVQG